MYLPGGDRSRTHKSIGQDGGRARPVLRQARQVSRREERGDLGESCADISPKPTLIVSVCICRVCLPDLCVSKPQKTDRVRQVMEVKRCLQGRAKIKTGEREQQAIARGSADVDAFKEAKGVDLTVSVLGPPVSQATRTRLMC